MKILHLMIKEKFTKIVSGFYDDFYADKGHEILYINRNDAESIINPDLKIPQYEIVFKNNNDFAAARKLIKKMEQYDYIVLHSMMLYTSVLMLLYPNKKLIKRIIWIEWGYDLYTENQTRFKRLLDDRIKNNAEAVNCIFPPDCDEFKRRYPNARARVYYAPYCSSRVSKFFQTEFVKLPQPHTTYIQIGHSATRLLKHNEILDKLAKFKDEDIKIVLPINYGDMQYSKEVAKHAKELFGDKAITLTDFIPLQEYEDLIEKIDIFILNSKRQIALGNVYKHVFKDSKIFLNRNTVMFDFYKDSGAPIQAIEDIDSMDFNEFISEPVCEEPKKLEFLKYSLSNAEYKHSLWDALYSSLK